MIGCVPDINSDSQKNFKQKLNHSLLLLHDKLSLISKLDNYLLYLFQE